MICPYAQVEPPNIENFPVAHDVLDLLVMRVAFYHTAIPPEQYLLKVDEAFPPGCAFETMTHLGQQPGSRTHTVFYDSRGRLTLSVRRATLDTSSASALHTFKVTHVNGEAEMY